MTLAVKQATVDWLQAHPWVKPEIVEQLKDEGKIEVKKDDGNN